MIKSVFRFFNSDGLLKDSSVLLVGMAGIHVLNLLFQIVMGRKLAPDEYALLVTLIGILNILIIPLGVVASAMNRYSSILIKQGRHGDVRRLIFRWGGRLALLGVFCSVFCFLIPGKLAAFFHLGRSAPILIFGVILTGVFCRPVVEGALMGMQCFKMWSFSGTLGWGMRLVGGGILVICVSPFAGWGLLGHGIGFYVAMVVGGGYVLWRLRGYVSCGDPLPKMKRYMFASFFVLLGYSVLMTGDIVLVKHLRPEDAGDFAYAATLGRLVVFIPQAFVAAMFPKVVSDEGGTVAQFKLYIRTLLMTLISTLFSAVVFSFIVRYALRFIWGIDTPSADLLFWSRLLAWAMIPVAVLSVSVRFSLAQKRFGAAAAVPVAALVYLGLCFIWGSSVRSMLFILIGCSISAGSAMTFFLMKFRRSGCA